MHANKAKHAACRKKSKYIHADTRGRVYFLFCISFLFFCSRVVAFLRFILLFLLFTFDVSTQSTRGGEAFTTRKHYVVLISLQDSYALSQSHFLFSLVSWLFWILARRQKRVCQYTEKRSSNKGLLQSGHVLHTSTYPGAPQRSPLLFAVDPAFFSRTPSPEKKVAVRFGHPKKTNGLTWRSLFVSHFCYTAALLLLSGSAIVGRLSQDPCELKREDKTIAFVPLESQESGEVEWKLCFFVWRCIKRRS